MTLMNTISILETGEITLEGQFLWGSNYTLLVDVICEDEQIKAVTNPHKAFGPSGTLKHPPWHAVNWWPFS